MYADHKWSESCKKQAVLRDFMTITSQKVQSNSKSATKEAKAEKKQAVLECFLKKLDVHPSWSKQLEDSLQTEEQFLKIEMKCEVQLVLLDIIEKINCIHTRKPCFVSSQCSLHLTWEFRAVIIAFWIHLHLGAKNYKLSALTFDVNDNTLKTWITQKQFLLKWIPIPLCWHLTMF